MNSILYLGKTPGWSDGLKDRGYAFRFAQQPLPGLPVPEELVIVDLGLAAAREVLQSWDGLKPLIVIDDTAHREGATAAVRARASDYLLKPFAPSELLSAVNETLRWPESLEKAVQEFQELAELYEGSPVRRASPLPRVSQARRDALHGLFLLLRAQALPKADFLCLWKRICLLERIYLHGHCHPVADDPAPYLLLYLDILAIYPGRAPYPVGAVPEGLARFLDRVEQREIDESLFLSAAALQLCGDRLPPALQARYRACWS